MTPPVVCFFSNSHGDWGGASRVLFTNLWQIDTSRLTPLIVLPDYGPIEPELQKRNLRYEVWPYFTEPGSVITYLKAFWRTWRFCKKNHIDVIHVNGANFWRPAELLAAKFAGIPVVAHYHLINDNPSPAMKWCSAAISVSEYTAAQSGPPGLAKPVIYNPIDLSRFDAGHSMRGELGIEDNAIVVVYIGQIRDIKGVSDFIAMARRVEEPRARFLLAGECRDPDRFPGSYSPQQLEDMAQGDSRIQYIGYQGSIENVYHTADIIVAPSRWQEPLGLINLEAGACRKPIVATRVGGIPEVVNDGETGYLVDAEDIDSLTARVTELVADNNKRKQFGAAGRQFVEAGFTSKPVRDFEDLLIDIANRPGR